MKFSSRPISLPNESTIVKVVKVAILSSFRHIFFLINK